VIGAAKNFPSPKSMPPPLSKGTEQVDEIFKDPDLRHMSLVIGHWQGTSFETECPDPPIAPGGERPDVDWPR
jgi:hypothetical protein